MFVLLSAKVRYRLFTRPLKIVFNGLMSVRSKGKLFSSFEAEQNVTPNANNVVQGSINTSDLVDKQYFVSPSLESSLEYEVISTPESRSPAERNATPAAVFNDIL